MATIPPEAKVEAHFLAKEDGVIAGIALAEMIFNEADPALKVKTMLIIMVLLSLLVLKLIVVSDNSFGML